MRYVRVDSTHGAPCWADMLGKTAWLLSKAGNDVFASWALLVGLMLRQAATRPRNKLDSHIQLEVTLEPAQLLGDGVEKG